MSANTQTNGKKSGSSNSSTVNTPAPTPVSHINGQATTQSSPPPNNAPKYGTLVPNRIFVGGISSNTTESELLQLFSNYGTVKAAKIIQDRAGVSRGYGFITFESEDDAKRLQREADNITLRERKLNIAPAIKKQPFNRAFDASSPPAVAPGNTPYYFQPSAAMPFFQGGMAYYTQPPAAPADPATAPQPAAAVYQPPAVYPPQSAPPQTATYPSVMFPQPVYVPQHYPIHMPYEYNFYPPNGGPQYVMGNQNGPQPQGPPMQPPGSPPRPPCYNQQMPYSTDPMYYNISMYGPVEGTALYTESMDIPNNNPYIEEPYAMADGTAQDSVAPPHHPQTSLPSDTDHHHSHSPFSSESTSQQHDAATTRTTITTTTAPQSQSNVTQSTETARQSSTPVVSLLSLDHRHERDPTSMQGGRRRRSLPSAHAPAHAHIHHHHIAFPPVHFGGYAPAHGHGYAGFYAANGHAYPANGHAYPANGHAYPANGHAYAANGHAYPANGHAYAGNGHAFGQSPLDDVYGGNRVKNNGNSTMINGGLNNRRRRTITIENSETGSKRSDSNSSASVDENRNEENKVQRTELTSPPPAPYSPITQYGLKFNPGTRNASFAPRGRTSYGDRARIVNNNNNSNGRKFYGQKTAGVGVTAANNNNNRDFYQQKDAGAFVGSNNGDYSLGNSNAQVNNNSAMMQQQQQHFVPPSRNNRNRRNVRRTTTALSEIGAGDAPLAQTDVADACKKLDSLKL